MISLEVTVQMVLAHWEKVWNCFTHLYILLIVTIQFCFTHEIKSCISDSNQTNQKNICHNYFVFSLFTYSYVQTSFGSFLPLCLPPPLHPPPTASRQNLFCPFLQFCWRVNISNNKKGIGFLLVEIKIAIQRDS
jgi:hypothetical protein